MTINVKLQVKLLEELQSVDIQLREMEEEISNIPILIEEAKSSYNEKKNALDQFTAEKEEAEKKRREMEREIEATTNWINERENKLYAIKTNKEYQATIKEIADAKNANREREEEVIRLMETAEKVSEEITQLSSKVAEEQSKFKAREDELKARKVELGKEVEKKREDVKSIEEKIDKSILAKYNSIRERYLDPLAAVKGGVCDGCNMNIPPQMFNELLKGVQFHFCPNCFRFIYAKEEKDEESETDET